MHFILSQTKGARYCAYDVTLSALVDGFTDEADIANKFESYFAQTCSNLSKEGSTNLKNIYEEMRPNYCGLPYDDELLFDVELVDWTS